MKLALVVATLAALAASPALAYDVARNGGFEAASLVDWQTFNQGQSGGTGSWYAHSSGNGTYSGLPTSPPPSGVWQAVADNNGRAAAILYQDITIPATTRATLSFVLWLGNAAPGGGYVNGANLSPGNTNQRVRVDLISTSTGLLTTTGALQLLYQTGASTPQIVNPMTVTADVTALAGQTVRLRAALVATNGGMIAGIDDVKLEVVPFAIHPAAPLPMYNSHLAWADFDLDGRYELAMNGELDAFTRGGLIARWSEGAGAWQPMIVLSAGYGGSAPADIDGDGDLDLGLVGVANGPSFDLMKYYNDGFGGFSAGYDPLGVSEGSLAWGDYDRDGDLDALVCGASSPYAATFLGRNDGSGGLTRIEAGLAGVFLGNAMFADVDNTGVLDIALLDGLNVRYYHGDGNGTFYEASSGLVDLTSGSVEMGDLDNDGIDELVVVGHRNFNPPAAKVYKYDGAGWYEVAAGLTGVYGSSVTLGDFDNDGWVDIATIGTPGSGYLAQVYRNNGNLTFTDINANLPGVYAGAMAFGDFEGDGDLDLAYQGTNDATGVHTYLAVNSTPTPNAAPTPPGLLFSQIGEVELLLRFGSFGNDDHTPPAVLTRNFRAGTAPGTCNLVPPMSDMATGRRLVARPGESRLTSWKRLALSRIGHHYAVHWSVQNVDQSYLGSGWAPEQTAVLGPTLLSVADVPNDQGGRVRVTVQKSPFDDESRSIYATTGYNLWRLVPATVAEAVARGGVPMDAAMAAARLARAGAEAGALGMIGEGGVTLVEQGGRMYARSPGINVASPFPAGTWEIVASWFATQQSSYLVEATTVADSGLVAVNDQTYMVTMHTTTPSVWFASLPVSGHSVDNLAPAPPVGLAAAHHTGSGNQLSWQPAPETDFESFRVYRGTTPGFTASPATLVASVAEPSWTDPSYDSPIVFYKVSTTDHAGNESAAVPPGSTTAVEEPSAAALTFAIAAPSPNPFGEATRIAFTLPRGAHTRLEVFDASGRRVRTLVSGWQPAGAHAAEWRGEDDAGGRVGAGVYFCRLEAGELRATRRVARMK